MIAENVHVAASAQGHAAAGAQDGQVVGLKGFHNVEAYVCGDFEMILLVVAIHDIDADQVIRYIFQSLLLLRGQK